MDVRDDLLVYLAGPISPKDGFLVEENVASALGVYLQLVRHGIPTICPQLSGMFPSAWTEVTYDEWTAIDFAVIRRCTHVLLLPRWDRSAGARAEKAYAEQHGIRVVQDIVALVPDLLRED